MTLAPYSASDIIVKPGAAPFYIESISKPATETKSKISKFEIIHPSGSHTGLSWKENGDIFYHSACPPGYYGFDYKQVSPSAARDILYTLVTNMNKGDKIDFKV